MFLNNGRHIALRQYIHTNNRNKGTIRLKKTSCRFCCQIEDQFMTVVIPNGIYAHIHADPVLNCPRYLLNLHEEFSPLRQPILFQQAEKTQLEGSKTKYFLREKSAINDLLKFNKTKNSYYLNGRG